MFCNLDFHILLYIQGFCETKHLLYRVNKELFATLYKHRKSHLIKGDFLWESKNIRKKFYDSFHSLSQIRVTFHQINFTNVDIQIFKELGKVYGISLTSCSGLSKKKLNCLTSITEVYIGHFYKRIDVSMFKNARIVTLDCIPNLTGTNALNAVHTLTIRSCTSITNADILSLGTVHNLTLDYCPYVTEVNHLSTVNTLALLCLPRISSVENLGTVQNLTIRSCLNLFNYSNLGTVRNLTITKCPITNIENFGTVQKLSLLCCHLVTDESIDALKAKALTNSNNNNLTITITIQKCNKNINAWCSDFN